MTDAPPEQPKLQIRIIPVTPLQQNCSLIWNDEHQERRASSIPGGDIDQLVGALDHFGLTLTRIWLTHGHFDHAGAAAELRARFGVAVEGPHRDDQFWLDLIEEGGASATACRGCSNVTPDRYLEDGETLEFEGVTLRCFTYARAHARPRRDPQYGSARSPSSATSCSRARSAAPISRKAITQELDRLDHAPNSGRSARTSRSSRATARHPRSAANARAIHSSPIASPAMPAPSRSRPISASNAPRSAIPKRRSRQLGGPLRVGGPLHPTASLPASNSPARRVRWTPRANAMRRRLSAAPSHRPSTSSC
jgi:hypothetical protein